MARAAEVGAQDYLIRGRFDAEGLARAIRYALERKRYADVLRENEQRDAAERKRAEEERRENHERYQRLVETAYEGILVLDTAARVTFVNPRMAEMVGWAPAEAIGRSIEDFLFEDQVPAFWTKFAKRPDREVYEWRLRRRDGGAVWAVVSAAALRDPRGQFVGSLAMITDITDRKRVEIELRKLSEAVAQASSPIMITDAAGNIEYVNHAFSTTTGFAADEVWGKNPRFLRSGEMDPSVYRELWERITSGETWQGELCNRKKSGELFWETTVISPVRDAEGRITHFMSTALDVTRRRELEQQLTQAQKMEAVGRLAGGVAHDFNNVLSVITGYSELALRKLSDDAPVRRHLEEILKAAERAATLTRQLLAFSRKQVLRPVVLDLGAVVAEVQKMLRRLIGEDIDLVATPEPGLGKVLADPGQIEQVLMNLAVNARDAMPNGGTLTLRTADCEVDEAASRRLPGFRAGRYVTVTVSDTGQGIPERIRGRIFEPFFTTKEAGKGTGLGLATVYGIVKQSDGFIYVDSEVGVGTTFTIYLPRVERKASRPARAAATAAAGGPETILLAEDDPSLREITKEMLEASGYTVIAAASGQEALRLASEHGAVALLVTDVIMSGMSGRELAADLERTLPRLPVLYVSGYTADVIGPKGLLEPGISLLPKPYTAEALLGKVREILDRPR